MIRCFTSSDCVQSDVFSCQTVHTRSKCNSISAMPNRSMRGVIKLEYRNEFSVHAQLPNMAKE